MAINVLFNARRAPTDQLFSYECLSYRLARQYSAELLDEALNTLREVTVEAVTR